MSGFSEHEEWGFHVVQMAVVVSEPTVTSQHALPILMTTPEATGLLRPLLQLYFRVILDFTLLKTRLPFNYQFPAPYASN